MSNLPTATIQPRNAIPLWVRRWDRWAKKRMRSWSLPMLCVQFAFVWLVIGPCLFAHRLWHGEQPRRL